MCSMFCLRLIVHISNINTLKSIYYAYFHSIIQYRIILWGNSSNSVKIFILQKKIIRVLAVAQLRTSGRSLLKHLEMSPFPCQYIVALITSLSLISNILKQIHLYTILKQGISTIFTDKTPTYLFSKKYILSGHQIFYQQTHRLKTP
jgi:hypothetical protein